jgi:hypothetical protein
MARRVKEGPLPLTTPARNFAPYVPPAALRKLTRRAAALTKRDLLLLDNNRFTPATRRLTVEDMNSLRSVFAQANAQQAKKPKDGSYFCCCCCCYFCCCCTAVSVTAPHVARGHTATLSRRAAVL